MCLFLGISWCRIVLRSFFYLFMYVFLEHTWQTGDFIGIFLPLYNSALSFCFRVLLDRAHSDYDNTFHQLDLEMLSSSQHSSISQFANTSETNTSDKSFSKDLSQILVNIKSCRWRHFRPRTPSLHDSDNEELSCKKLYRGVNRTGTAQPGTQICSTSIQSKSSSGSAHFGMFILTNFLPEILNLTQKIQNIVRSPILCFMIYLDGSNPSFIFATQNVYF